MTFSEHFTKLYIFCLPVIEDFLKILAQIFFRFCFVTFFLKFFNIFPKFVKNTNWKCQVWQILVSFWWQTLAQRKPPFPTGFSCWLLKKFLQCNTVRYSQNCCFWSKCQKSSSMRLKQLKNPDADLILYFPCLCNIRLINPLKRYFNKINVFCWKFWKLWKTVTPSIFIAEKSYRPF